MRQIDACRGHQPAAQLVAGCVPSTLPFSHQVPLPSVVPYSASPPRQGSQGPVQRGGCTSLWAGFFHSVALRPLKGLFASLSLVCKTMVRNVITSCENYSKDFLSNFFFGENIYLKRQIAPKHNSRCGQKRHTGQWVHLFLIQMKISPQKTSCKSTRKSTVCLKCRFWGIQISKISLDHRLPLQSVL